MKIVSNEKWAGNDGRFYRTFYIDIYYKNGAHFNTDHSSLHRHQAINFAITRAEELGWGREIDIEEIWVRDSRW